MRGRRRRRGGGKSGGSNFYHRAAFPQVHFAVPLDNGAHIRIRGGAVRAAKREEKNVKGKKKKFLVATPPALLVSKCSL